MVPLVFCENRNISVLKQAFEEELGFAAPQIYRQQVADFARLYREEAAPMKLKASCNFGRGSRAPKRHAYSKMLMASNS